MTEDVIANTLGLLKKDHDFFEVYHVNHFEGYRRDRAGNDQKVNLKILDMGPDAQRGLRYHVWATVDSDEGKTAKFASGNAADSIQTVLAILHWQDLDK